MTDYAPTNNGWQPSDGASSTPTSDGGAAAAKDTAKDKAADVTQSGKQAATDVAQSGKQAATDVAQTAASAAKDVAHETKQQATDLVGKTRSELTDQVVAQKGAVVEGLRSLADQLGAMTDDVTEDGTAIDLASKARDRAHGAAEWLDAHEPNEILDELRTIGRKNPGTFLLGALVAGVVAGRLTRGAVAVHSDSNNSTAPDSTSPGNTPTTGVTTPGIGGPARHSTPAANPVTDTPSFGRPVADASAPIGYQPTTGNR